MMTLTREADKKVEDGPILGPVMDRDAMQWSSAEGLWAGHSVAIATLAERAYARLRYALIVGQVFPGECLPLRRLATQLGTSVTPVRDALSRLAPADALLHNRQAGVVVPVLSKGDLDELVQLRLAVEVFAFENSASWQRAAEWRGLKVLHKDVCRLAESGEPARFAAAVWSIRAAILGLSRTSVLATLVERIWCRLGPTFTYMAVERERRRRLSEQLETIVAATGRRDLGQARQAVIDEIKSSMIPLLDAAVDVGSAPPLVPAWSECEKEKRRLQTGADHV
jgi:DNA-binding GntR family transcriptional regulator